MPGHCKWCKKLWIIEVALLKVCIADVKISKYTQFNVSNDDMTQAYCKCKSDTINTQLFGIRKTNQHLKFFLNFYGLFATILLSGNV